MEHLGCWGIITLTNHIILKNLKHFLCIAFLLAIPSALNFILFGTANEERIRALAPSTSLLHKLSASHAQLDPHSDDNRIPEQHYPSYPFLSALSIFHLVISLFCTLLINFSVCRACIDKSLDLKGSLHGALRSAKNLVLTALLVIAAFFAYCMVVSLVMLIIGAVVQSAVHANVWLPIMIIMVIGIVVGGVYTAVEFSLANSVAILEEKAGWEAMKRSIYLIKGSRWTLIGLHLFYGVLSFVLLFVVYAVFAVSEEASVVWRCGAGVVNVGLQAFIVLCSSASQVVLYMSCKSKHAEPLQTLPAASARFGPQQAEYTDLETAAFATTIK